MSKFTTEEKLQAVIRYIHGNESLREIAKSIGTVHQILLRWVKQFENHGEKAFVKQYTNYTQQFKMDVLNFMTENGTSLDDTAAIFNIPAPSTILAWKKQLETKGSDALQSNKKGRPSMKKDSAKQPKQTPAEGTVEALEVRIKQLEMENEYLKKLNALVQNKEKLSSKRKRK
jgi:transposase